MQKLRLIWLLTAAGWVISTSPSFTQGADPSTRSWPPDTSSYYRPAVPEDRAPGGKPALSGPGGPLVVDVVVNNTDPNLMLTDTFGDEEVGIAVNPENPNEIVITSFAGFWSGPGTNAPIWHSTDGGNTWTKQFQVPVPPGAPGTAGCPCDQNQRVVFTRSDLATKQNRRWRALSSVTREEVRYLFSDASRGTALPKKPLVDLEKNPLGHGRVGHQRRPIQLRLYPILDVPFAEACAKQARRRSHS